MASSPVMLVSSLALYISSGHLLVSLMMSLFFSPLPLLWFASAPTWAARVASYRITLAVLNVGFSLGSEFLSEIMLQSSSVM
jgi:hypothetical protein